MRTVNGLRRRVVAYPEGIQMGALNGLLQSLAALAETPLGT